MTKKEAIKAVKKAYAVFGAVKLTNDSIQYFQLTKKDVLRYLNKQHEDDVEFDFSLNSVDNCVYIN